MLDLFLEPRSEASAQNLDVPVLQQDRTKSTRGRDVVALGEEYHEGSVDSVEASTEGVHLIEEALEVAVAPEPRAAW